MTSKVTGEGDDGAAAVKKSIDIFIYKEWHLNLDMKTKVVQHVLRMIFNIFKVFTFSGFQFLSIFSSFSKHSWFPAFVWHSDIFRMDTTLWTKVRVTCRLSQFQPGHMWGWGDQTKPFTYCTYKQWQPVTTFQFFSHFPAPIWLSYICLRHSVVSE